MNLSRGRNLGSVNCLGRPLGGASGKNARDRRANVSPRMRVLRCDGCRTFTQPAVVDGANALPVKQPAVARCSGKDIPTGAFEYERRTNRQSAHEQKVDLVSKGKRMSAVTRCDTINLSERWSQPALLGWKTVGTTRHENGKCVKCGVQSRKPQFPEPVGEAVAVAEPRLEYEDATMPFRRARGDCGSTRASAAVGATADILPINLNGHRPYNWLGKYVYRNEMRRLAGIGARTASE